MERSREQLTAGLDQVWKGFARTVASIGPDEWSRSTPCEEWDVHDLVAHVGGIEGGFQGFPPVPVPEGFTTPHTGIDQWTAAAVAARRDWSPEQVVDEAQRAGAAQCARYHALDDAGWDEKTMGPLGETTMEGLAQVRLFDLALHLYDLRAGLGRDLEVSAEPDAAAGPVLRAVSLAGWGATKKAKLPDGTRIRLELTGPAGTTDDVVVEGGRGRVEPPAGEPDGWIRGSAAAFALIVAGRESLADQLGGVHAEGEAARELLDRYRFFQ
jgi:uncharacterized protein (TIGR03083 family)